MKKIKQILTISSFVALIFPTAILAAPPAIPLFVYGDVIIDNNNAPVGTSISVEKDGTEIINIITSEEGKYYLEVPAVYSGNSLDYKVNDELALSKICADPSIVPSDRIDLEVVLAVTPPSEPYTPPSSGGGGGGGGGGASSPPPVPTADILSNPDPEPEEAGEKDTEDEVVVLGVEEDYRTIQLNNILSEAGYIYTGDADMAAANVSIERNLEEETAGYNKYTALLIDGIENLDQSNIDAITNFIVYGTETTLKLGAGERAGVVNSYKSAFGKLPSTQSEWEDVIKIANGRWPGETSESAETKAKEIFKKIYLRDADMGNPNDNAATTIIAYGLRPDVRNLDSEKAAILTFEAIYKYSPSSAVDWDTVRAIAYSGATR